MTKKQTLVQQLVAAALFVAVVILLGFLSTKHKAEIDWTANKRNSLSEASLRQLDSMKDPVAFKVFLSGTPESRGEVDSALGRYRRAKPDITVDFIDPSTHPDKAREYNVSFAGEVVIEYQGRRESLRALSEQTITTALQRLAFSGEQWVVFLEGHGERSATESQSQTAVSKFAQALRDKGLKVNSLSLVKTPKIPDNTSVLVLASPTSQPLPGEVGSSRVDLQACKLEYSIVSPK